MRLSRNKAFTLVELIIVIAVIGVLAAILIPVFSNVIKKANAKSALADARNAVSMYVTESLDKRVHGDTSSPENITLIVEKGGRYYAFGYNTAASNSILVSNANEDGMSASDLDALINDHSFNVQNGGTYDPDTTYTLSDGAFYLVPYTGTTPDNTNVRGFVSSESASGNFLRLDEEAAGYGFDLNVGNTTAVFHGCLVSGTYETTSVSSASTGAPETPSGAPADTPESATHTVTFAISGVDSADEANVVIKQNGTAVTGSSVTVTGDTTPVASFTAEYPHESTDEYWYTFESRTPASGLITDDVTITFNFTKELAQRYSVTYNANSGTGSTTDSATYLANAIVTLKANGFTAPEHKHFDGWRVGDVTKQPGDTFSITADTTVYAKWADDEQYTVGFNSNGGTGSMSSVSVYGGNYTLPSCGFTREGYHFTGWKANNTGETMPATSTYDVSAAVTFYAQWAKDTYTVNFYANGSLHASSTVDYGDTVSAPANPSKTGYTFKHWSTENNGANATTGAEFNLSTAITANKDLYAVWQINSYTVTFTDGTNSQNKSYNYNTTITLADENPLTAPGGKELDKFTVGGADATTLTLTAATTVTVVWKDVASSGSEMTLTLSYKRSSTGASDGDFDMPITCGINETITFNVTQLKQGGYYPTASGKNFISVTNGTTLVMNTGEISSSSGSIQYTLSYTRPDVRTEDTLIVYVYPVRSTVTDSVVYGDPNIPNLNIIQTRSIPGINDPWEINALADFIAIGADIYSMADNYILMSDIDLSSVTWEPFGYGLGTGGADLEFTGTLDGNNHTISGLEIALGDPVVDQQAQTTTYYQNVGLFAMLGSGSIVQDLIIQTTANGVDGGMVVGIVAGQNAGTIDNVVVTGPVNTEDPTSVDPAYVVARAADYYSYVGGLVGYNEGLIENCTVEGVVVYGYVEAGGAVGENVGEIYNTDVILNGVNTQIDEQTITSMGMNYIGGFVGLNDSGYIHDCTVAFTDSAIVKGNNYIGGFCGENTRNSTTENSAKLLNCEASGAEVYGRQYVGGFCGYNQSMSASYKAEIVNCDISVFDIDTAYYSEATILANLAYVGGFVGCNNGDISQSSADFIIITNTHVSYVVGYQRVGGFAGRNDSLGNIATSACTDAYVVGYMFAGGFCAENYGTITESFANNKGLNSLFTDNDILSTYPTYIGGLIGANRGTVTSCYAITENIIKGYNYVGGLMGAHYSNAQSTGYVANCFSDCLVYGATKDISIAYVSNATVIGLYHVSNQTTSNYSTRVSYNAITSSSFASICNWNTQLSTLWSFTDGDYPNLVNNPR